MDKDREEVEQLRGMSEEERRAYQRLNPKVITNQASKGKYKFLQKYFHRGVFYLVSHCEVLGPCEPTPQLLKPINLQTGDWEQDCTLFRYDVMGESRH